MSAFVHRIPSSIAFALVLFVFYGCSDLKPGGGSSAWRVTTDPMTDERFGVASSNGLELLLRIEEDGLFDLAADPRPWARFRLRIDENEMIAFPVRDMESLIKQMVRGESMLVEHDKLEGYVRFRLDGFAEVLETLVPSQANEDCALWSSLIDNKVISCSTGGRLYLARPSR